MTSRLRPSAISLQASQTPQGVVVGPSTQLRALARIRAVEVFPMPRGPTKRYAGEPVGGDRVLERAGDVVLADDLIECLGTILSRENPVAHGRTLPASRAGIQQDFTRRPQNPDRDLPRPPRTPPASREFQVFGNPVHWAGLTG